MFEGLKQWFMGLFALVGIAFSAQAPMASVSPASVTPSPTPQVAHWPVGTKPPKNVAAASVTPVSPEPVVVMPQPQPEPQPLPTPLPKPPYKCAYLYSASDMPSSPLVCPCHYVMGADENIRACRPPVEY